MLTGKKKLKPKPPKERVITHERLVRAAKEWLRGTKHCRVVATELSCTSGETPDAIGWGYLGESILVECKTSRSDFKADQKKTHRHWGGVGKERWYFTTRGLVRPKEVPKGWGLAEYRRSEHAKGYYVRVIVKPGPEEAKALTEDEMFGELWRIKKERQMLVSVAWRALEALSLVGRLGIGPGDDDHERETELRPTGREQQGERERLDTGEVLRGQGEPSERDDSSG